MFIVNTFNDFPVKLNYCYIITYYSLMIITGRFRADW